jgi:hypothetical protein
VNIRVTPEVVRELDDMCARLGLGGMQPTRSVLIRRCLGIGFCEVQRVLDSCASGQPESAEEQHA